LTKGEIAMTIRSGLCAFAIALTIGAGIGVPATRADDVITTHRLSAALASEAAAEAVASCAKQGYRVSAVILDLDGLTQAALVGDGATAASLEASHDKAYTVIMLGAVRNEDSTGAIAERIGANPNAGGLVKLPHILLLQGGLRIKAGNEAIAAIGVGGAPGGGLDEACAKAGIDKISAHLK
jgi:uncharacterized protein GlcG (DUF336 family)